MTNVREPAVAGQFYPASERLLRAEVEGLLAAAEATSSPVAVRALIVPHAGYVYSGATAARTFAAARGRHYDRALVLAPSHRVPFSGVAVADFAAYRTPLGEMPLDREALTAMLVAGSGTVRALPQAHHDEHALEVELPFLQTLFPGLPLAPLICGHLAESDLPALTTALSPYWTADTLWVISSDFTHYGASFGYLPFTDRIPERLEALDRGAIDRILALDGAGFTDYVAKTGATICGANPIRLLLAVIAAGHAPVTAKLVDYTTSGQISGDWRHCVSYAGIVVHE